MSFDPTIGSKIAKTRPAVIVSPDEMNAALATVIVAAMTRTAKGWPSRVPVKVGGVSGEVALDQARAVDKTRPFRRIGRLSPTEAKDVIETLVEIFAP